MLHLDPENGEHRVMHEPPVDNLKKAMLNGSAIAVAMSPPHRKAAAKSQGVSRSRRSRNQSIASGTRASRLERASARKNTLRASGGIPVKTIN